MVKGSNLYRLYFYRLNKISLFWFTVIDRVFLAQAEETFEMMPALRLLYLTVFPARI